MTLVMSCRCLSQSYAGRSIGGECALSVTPLPFGRRLIVVNCHHVSLREEGRLKHWQDLLTSPVPAENVGRTQVSESILCRSINRWRMRAACQRRRPVTVSVGCRGAAQPAMVVSDNTVDRPTLARVGPSLVRPEGTLCRQRDCPRSADRWTATGGWHCMLTAHSQGHFEGPLALPARGPT